MTVYHDYNYDTKTQIHSEILGKRFDFFKEKSLEYFHKRLKICIVMNTRLILKIAGCKFLL